MRLRELAPLLLLSSIEGNEETEFHGIETDSRNVKPGDLFICLQGFRTDGHDHAADAVRKGAVALVIEKEVAIAGIPKLIVNDSRYASSVIAAKFYQYPSNQMKVIGVTGTNGKTTITYILEKLLRDSGHPTGVIGTIGMKFGDEVVITKWPTTPEPLELQRGLRHMLDQGAQYAVVEVTSQALDFGRVKGCDFHTAIFTNLTQDHLEHHGTMDNYRHAKSLLFSQLGNRYVPDPEWNKYAIMNADDKTSEFYQRVTAAQVITYGIDRKADVMADHIEIGPQGTRFRMSTFWGNEWVEMPLVGQFNVYNVLAAATAALIEGIPLTAIRNSLASMPPVRGRFEPVNEGQDYAVIVDYAHTPDSVENVLKTVKEFAKGKIITVVGCGGDRDRTKRPIMGCKAAEYSDYVIITSDNPRSEDPVSIMEDITRGMKEAGVEDSRYSQISDRAEAIQMAVKLAEKDDVIIIAGKGHETYQIIKDQVLEFDDREEARKAIQRKYVL